jgi:hypothetical protein
MTSGKADAMKPFFMDKKFRISGDIMASQKLFLEFWKKIDRTRAAAPDRGKELLKRPAATSAATSAPKDGKGRGDRRFPGKRLADNGKLAAEIGALCSSPWTARAGWLTCQLARSG